MKQSEQGSFITPLAYFWIFIIVIGTVGYVFWSESQIKTSTAEPADSSPKTFVRDDINRDGKIDDVDRAIIRQQLGCTKTDPCWNTEIGKTLDGDNPIYSYDLDLNRDGTITEADIP